MLAACLLAGGLGRMTMLATDPASTVREALVVDINRDQQTELVLGLHHGETGERRIEAWRRETDSYARMNTGSAVLPEDAIAFAYASLGSGARDLVIFTPRAAYRHVPEGKEERDRWAKLFGIEFLWAAADPKRIFHVQYCVRDLDGDGLDEFVIPSHESWTTHRRTGDGTWTAQVHAVRAATLDEPFFRAEVRNEGRASQRFTRIGRRRDELPRFNNWITMRASVPNLVLEDMDADGRRDLAILTGNTFHWWHNTAGANFKESAQTEAYPLASKELRIVDITRSVRIQDINADGRADALAFAPGNLEKNQTQVLIWIGADKDGSARLFPGEKKPSQALILDGLAQAVDLRDVDGNGLPDLVVRALKPDLIDMIRSAATQEIDLQMHVFLNQKGVLSRRPDLTWTESTKAGFNTALFELLGDITGDGVSEALIRSKENTARVVSFRRGRDGKLSLLEKALWEGDTSKQALLVPSAISAQSPDVFWYSEEGVSCLSLR